LRDRKNIRLKNKLRIARAETNETQAEIAYILGISIKAYNQKELGKKDFTQFECILLALHFRKSLDYLFYPDDNVKNELNKIFFENQLYV
jgi:DNA-binding XRE family transcriptional regulator